MSYLDSPRLHFCGWFQADVSTINNDVRVFQNASFAPEYQQRGQNGSWNPEGTGVFRLLDCSVTGAVLNGNVSPVAGITVQNADRRAPGKLVDLDPQQQMVSQIWGMQVRLVDSSGNVLVKGEFKPAAFINLWLRQQTKQLNDQQLCAVYQSVLEAVEFGDVSAWPFLVELQGKTQDSRLSIDFNVYGYGRDPAISRYTMGHINGTMGPYFHGEPQHFTRGRQLIFSGTWPIPAGGMGNSQMKVAADNNSITADLGNSFPFETANAPLMNIGPVFLAVLNTNPAAILSTVDSSQFTMIGEVPYLSSEPGGDWYTQTAGLQTFDLTNNAAARQLLPDNPVVVLTPSGTSYRVLLQESIDGIYVRADNYVYRMDAAEKQEIDFYADRFGVALANAVINLSSTAGFMGGSGGGPTLSPITRPAAPIPAIGTPAAAIQFDATVTTDAAGKATAQISASAGGPGTPRGYLSNQLYGIGYQLAIQPPGYVSNPMNYISILAFTKKDVPETPTWYRDIQYLFTQYGNLYPIMGRYVVDLSDYDAVVTRLKALHLAFSLPIEDPNHMPVTRDMGIGDRNTILRWLTTVDQHGLPPLGTPDQSPQSQPPQAVDLVAETSPIEPLPSQAAGKSAVILQIQQRAKVEALKKGGVK